MRVAALVRHTVRPGLEPEFVAAVVRRMQVRRLRIPSLRPAILLRSLAQPQRFCWLGEWESEADYEARAQEMGAEFAPYCTSPPAAAILTHLRVREHIGERMAAVTCGVIQATPDGADAVRTMAREYIEVPLENTPDLTWRALYQAVAEPTCFVVIRGWRTVGGAEAFIRTQMGGIRRQLTEQGAHFEVFSGRVWVDTDRTALPQLRMAAD